MHAIFEIFADILKNAINQNNLKWHSAPGNTEIEKIVIKWISSFIGYNKNAGGIIETGNIARRPGAVPPLSGPNPQGSGIVGLFSSPKRVNIT